MLPIGLNHMTVPHASARVLLDVAQTLGCVGVELRNDINQSLFDGDAARDFGAYAADKGQQILALAEVKAFNADPAAKQDTAEALIMTAALCGAKGVALIPALADQPIATEVQRKALRDALIILQPILEEHGQIGLIEPLGFSNSTLLFKQDVVAVLDDMNRPACFAIVHDTFHHHLAGETAMYPELTAIVHISGVCAPVAPQAMTDAHRVLVDADDRLGTIGQLKTLIADGYDGPASFEAFAPEIHDMTDPAAAVAGSIAFINQHLAADPVGVG